MTRTWTGLFTGRRRVVGDGDGVLVGEAGRAEVLGLLARGFQHAVEAQVLEAFHPQVFPDVLHRVGGGDQLLALRGVDAVEAGADDGRGRDAHVDLPGARVPQHADQLAAGGA